MPSHKVLVVEDYEAMQALFAAEAKFLGIELLQARSIEEASVQINGQGDEIAAILWDEEVGSQRSSQSLIPQVKASGYKGLMVAMSDSYSEDQLKAGCDVAFKKVRALHLTTMYLRSR